MTYSSRRLSLIAGFATLALTATLPPATAKQKNPEHALSTTHNQTAAKKDDRILAKIQGLEILDPEKAAVIYVPTPQDIYGGIASVSEFGSTPTVAIVALFYANGNICAPIFVSEQALLQAIKNNNTPSAKIALKEFTGAVSLIQETPELIADLADGRRANKCRHPTRKYEIKFTPSSKQSGQLIYPLPR